MIVRNQRHECATPGCNLIPRTGEKLNRDACPTRISKLPLVRMSPERRLASSRRESLVLVGMWY